MGFFDDLINNQADEYIDVFLYIEELSKKYKSSPRSVIAYLLSADIENLYIQDSTGTHYKSEEPNAVKKTLNELVFRLNQNVAQSINTSNEPSMAISETSIFEQMWDSGSYGGFKKSELPILPDSNSASQTPTPPNHIVGGKAKVGSLVTVQERETAAIPNKFQKITMLNDYFTPHQASCFMAGLHPNFNGSDDELEMAKAVIDGGIKKGKLIVDNDGQIKAENLKEFLSEKSWLLLGFNDYVTSKGSMSLGTMLKNKDNEGLQMDIEKAQAEIKKLKAENAQLKEQLEQQFSQPLIIDEDNKLIFDFDWHSIDEYQYPPELNLALIIWNKAYLTGDIKNPHITDHSAKFDAIAKRIGLNKDIHGAALIERLKKITTPQIKKQVTDIDKLRAIEGLNIKGDNPQE